MSETTINNNISEKPSNLEMYNLIKEAEAEDALRSSPGFHKWMEHWIFLDYVNNMWIYTCFHPDNRAFYTSSDPSEAISAFKKYPYDG